jgi:4-hydroxy-3-methylbut-2-enyl diphosphate reductase
MLNKKIIVAIDGYSSTGKSTVAKAIAHRLNYIYVDTGAMYRAVTLFGVQNGLIDSSGNISDNLKSLLQDIKIEFRKSDSSETANTFLNDVNVEKEIRSIDIAKHVSAVSAIPEVREFLVRQQQQMGQTKGIVMDGRDIGTVVFPDAELKIFMTASPEIRAMRRYSELKAKGEDVAVEDVRRNIEERDYKDTHRAVSPLKQADDAVVLDNSNMTPDEQLEWLYAKVKETVNGIRVEIDSLSGFCYGVIRAIETAEKELEKNGVLFSLGEIVHNSIEVNRLKDKGLKTISHKDIDRVESGKILIRAHGEPPETYETARRADIEIIDCTCPVVLKLQARIKRAYAEAKKCGGAIVIFGKKRHAEVNGLVGQTEGNAIVIETIDEVNQIDYTRPIYLFSQTTKSIEGFEELQTIIGNRIERMGGDITIFRAYNTVCRQVSGRKSHLEDFARRHDVIVFVSGKQSSNGKVLYQSCKSANPNSYFVEQADDIKSEWFSGSHTVGVCGATSTPKWLMEDVARRIEIQNTQH